MKYTSYVKNKNMQKKDIKHMKINKKYLHYIEFRLLSRFCKISCL